MRWALRVVALVAIVAMLVGCGSSGGTGSSASPHRADPGVASKTITIGFIGSQTGDFASLFKHLVEAFRARIEVENAKGGVNGRQIKIEVTDDASNGDANLTAAQNLVQN